MARKRKRNSYGLAVEMTYPREMVQEIADLLTDWRIPLDKAMTVIQRELAAKAYRDSRPQAGVEVHRLDETATVVGTSNGPRTDAGLRTAKGDLRDEPNAYQPAAR